MSADLRLWDKAMPEPNSGCWLWLGAISPNGYGNLRIGSMRDGSRRTVTAHRLAFELTHGPIPAGAVIMHACDNRACVNPDHLSIGTQLDNVADCWRKGRGRAGKGDPARLPHYRGEQNPRCKLSDSQVEELRRLAGLGRSHLSLAKVFGVSDVHVGRVVRGESR